MIPIGNCGPLQVHSNNNKTSLHLSNCLSSWHWCSIVCVPWYFWWRARFPISQRLPTLVVTELSISLVLGTASLFGAFPEKIDTFSICKNVLTSKVTFQVVINYDDGFENHVAFHQGLHHETFHIPQTILIIWHWQILGRLSPFLLIQH
jgi:hypothetical protein